MLCCTILYYVILRHRISCADLAEALRPPHPLVKKELKFPLYVIRYKRCPTLCVYIYIHIHTYVYIYIYIYTCIYREREMEIERERDPYTHYVCSMLYIVKRRNWHLEFPYAPRLCSLLYLHAFRNEENNNNAKLFIVYGDLAILSPTIISESPWLSKRQPLNFTPLARCLYVFV